MSQLPLKRLSVFNFKNYEEKTWDFSEGINAIVGKNGTGKTNLLDAVYYLSMTRSSISSVEQQNIKHEEDYFLISGKFGGKEEQQTVQAAYYKDRKQKNILLNKKEYQKFSEHIGRFPSVFIGPNDTDLVREGSEERRKFLDSMISQLDRNYLLNLQTYQLALKQRNALLRHFEEKRTFDALLIEPYDLKLKEIGKAIFETRKRFVQGFAEEVLAYYQELTPAKEAVSIEYKSHCWDEDFEEVFDEAIKKDIVLQRTTRGIHRDDLDFSIEGHPLKKFGSQGQQKSFVIALKLAQFKITKEQSGKTPLLLLDDIFDKLDDFRIKYLIQLLEAHTFGQVFLTDARPERSKELLQNLVSETLFIETSSSESASKSETGS